MASKDTPLPLDHKAIAEDLGEIVEGNGYSRLLGPDGKTLAYLKPRGVAAHVGHLKGLPKKLGVAVAEKNLVWANVATADTASARALVEYVVAQATTEAEKAGQA